MVNCFYIIIIVNSIQDIEKYAINIEIEMDARLFQHATTQSVGKTHMHMVLVWRTASGERMQQKVWPRKRAKRRENLNCEFECGKNSHTLQFANYNNLAPQ